MDILFGEGIDKMGCLLDAALDLDVVQRRGSWYSYKDSNFAQGRMNASVYLKENLAVANKMEEEVREALLMAKIPASSNENDSSIVAAADDGLDSSIVAEETSVLE